MSLEEDAYAYDVKNGATPREIKAYALELYGDEEKAVQFLRLALESLSRRADFAEKIKRLKD